MKKVIAVVIVAALILVVWVLQKNGTMDGLGGSRGGGGGPVILEGDDDRPPVVVSGGSVIIEQQVDAKDEIRGDFEQVLTGQLKKWRAAHVKPNNGGGKNPKGLTVIIDNSTSDPDTCGPTIVHKDVKSLTFEYKPTGALQTFTAAIISNALQFEFPVDVDQETANKFRLTVPDGTLQKVTFKVTLMGVEKEIECNLVPRGRVELRQRK